MAVDQFNNWEVFGKSDTNGPMRRQDAGKQQQLRGYMGSMIYDNTFIHYNSNILI